ncbi:PadR family transcriptional regulator [Actinokineospora diospyrosa]|uniref:Transcriptional regulator PadR-like family protein n=1 Tax=Actinokineospora diospyrosa TaxID=103728 RepID=A0ABT1IGB1_9PSEU|nr:PadR family transcriptional regulator [Actinokineospora diospyrosa]MCP2271688.1 Transcriptional regulator PadR-like family protein [Actinokineospora diospyrosa]
MSATRMLVLGVVFWAGKAHGYQIRAELQSWRADSWARIKPGSLYHALRKAVADELLVDTPEPGDGGPERTAYSITAAGRAELDRLVTAGLSVPGDPWMLNAAIAMLPTLSRADAVAHLSARIEALEVARSEMEGWRGGADPIKPEHVAEQAELWLAQLNADLVWSRGLVARLLDGAYSMSEHGEPPSIQV